MKDDKDWRDCIDILRYWYGWIDADEYCDTSTKTNSITGTTCSSPLCRGCRVHDRAEELLKKMGVL